MFHASMPWSDCEQSKVNPSKTKTIDQMTIIISKWVVWGVNPKFLSTAIDWLKTRVFP